MYQSITIVGNVGRDPELRYTPSGSAVCDFSVAVSESWTDRQSNERKEKTTWFKVTAWGRLAETVNQYVQKGRQIMVVGTVDASAWTGRDGEARASLELTARTVKFLGRRDEPASGQQFGGEPPSGDIPF